MKRLWILLAVAALQSSAWAQTGAVTRPQPPVTVSDVMWGGNYVTFRHNSKINGNPMSLRNRRARLYGPTTRTGGIQMRTMSVTVTNSGSVPIESVRLAFVFADPETGEEWFRYKAHSKKRLLPGASVSIEKAATATLGWPPRDELADKSVVITEIKYSDGSVWRHK